MNESQILEWMQKKLQDGQYPDAASLARAFLTEHNINNATDPDFSKAIDAGFKLANEIAQST